MYLYCGNNPISRQDSNGRFFGEIVDFFNTAYQETVEVVKSIMPVLAPVGAGLSAADGPLPFGDIIAGGIGLIGVGAATVYGISKAIDSSLTKEKTKSDTKSKIKHPKISENTFIYRHNGTNLGNLTPRKGKDDFTGLSFSTIPQKGSAATTIKAINSTGILIAVQDGPTHISVKPTNATIKEWIDAGPSSIWTQRLKSIVVKWNGGF